MASGTATILRATALVLCAALLTVHAADAAGDGRGDLTPNQFTEGRTLTPAEALAACGPAAAVAFARASGRPVTLDAAVALAREVGWTVAVGMAGPQSMVALLKRLGVPATLEMGVDRARILREVQAGRPVIVRAAGGLGHYFVAERYDPQIGKFDFGQSAIAVKRAAGNRWFSLDEIPALGVGTPRETIYLANSLGLMTHSAAAPLANAAPAKSSAPPGTSALRGATSGQRVVHADGAGARLRAEPSTEAKILGVLPDGARVTELGGEVAAGGRTWRRVGGPGGSPAWIASELLRPPGG